MSKAVNNDKVIEAVTSGASSLYVASFNGHVEVIKLLLSYGADINDKRSDNGISSLYYASEKGHAEVVELLLSQGATVHDISNSGFTAISVSAYYKITNTLRKWPITMAILIMQELCIYYQTDAYTLIDLYQYLG